MMRRLARADRWALGALALLLMEAQGLLHFHPLQPGRSLDISQGGLNLVTLVTALFGIVYLTGSVARQLLRTSIGLSETADTLQHRTEELRRVVTNMVCFAFGDGRTG